MYVSVIVSAYVGSFVCVCVSYINAYTMDTYRAFMGMSCVRAYIVRSCVCTLYTLYVDIHVCLAFVHMYVLRLFVCRAFMHMS